MSEADAVTVTVLPRGVTFTVGRGQSVFQAAVEQDVQWPTTCDGMGTCHLCFMSLIEGDEHVNAVEPFEAEGLAEVVDTARRGELRLACQVRPRGDLVVFKRGVRPRSRT